MRKGIMQLGAVLLVYAAAVAAPASAAPVGAGDVRGLKAAASEATAVDQVQYRRRCWIDEYGYRHCRRLYREYYYYDEPYYYYGPGFGFFFGGGGRHHHHHHRGHRR
jgi:hypothetical protein